jgi:hypothetical protein
MVPSYGLPLRSSGAFKRSPRKKAPPAGICGPWRALQDAEEPSPPHVPPGPAGDALTDGGGGFAFDFQPMVSYLLMMTNPPGPTRPFH